MKFDRKRVMPRLLVLVIALVIVPIAVLAIRNTYVHYVLGEDVALIPGACDTMPLDTIKSLAGRDFEVTYVNCDTMFSKDGAVNIYAMDNKAIFGRLLHRKTLIFKFDPSAEMEPTITSPGQNTILIAVPRISFVYKRRTAWDGITIKYDTPRIDYP